MHFKIATPERVMLETEADSVTLPTQQGEVTILPHHIPLVSNLVPGEVRYKQGGAEKTFVVSGGVLEVKDGNHIVVLADTAEFPHEIDLTRAEEARERARKLMTESKSDQKSFASAAALLEKNLVRIKVAKKHHTRRQQNLDSGNL